MLRSQGQLNRNTFSTTSHMVGGSTVEVTSSQGNYGVQYHMTRYSRQIRCRTRYRHTGADKYV